MTFVWISRSRPKTWWTIRGKTQQIPTAKNRQFDLLVLAEPWNCTWQLLSCSLFPVELSRDSLSWWWSCSVKSDVELNKSDGYDGETKRVISLSGFNSALSLIPVSWFICNYKIFLYAFWCLDFCLFYYCFYFIHNEITLGVQLAHFIFLYVFIYMDIERERERLQLKKAYTLYCKRSDDNGTSMQNFS